MWLQVAVKLLPWGGPQTQDRLLDGVAVMLHASRTSGHVAKVLAVTVKDDKLCVIMKEYRQSLKHLIDSQLGGVFFACAIGWLLVQHSTYLLMAMHTCTCVSTDVGACLWLCSWVESLRTCVGCMHHLPIWFSRSCLPAQHATLHPLWCTDHAAGLEVGCVLMLAVDILSGLADLHEADIAMLGLKPENILLDDVGKALLVDVGLSKAMAASTSASITSVEATHYM